METTKQVVDGARRQRVVVERHGTDWYVMLNEGDVQVVGSAAAALRAVKQQAARGNKGMTLTSVEWRGVPEGWEPPR